MEENKTEEKEEFKTISLKKYVWPDEAKFRAEKAKNKAIQKTEKNHGCGDNRRCSFWMAWRFIAAIWIYIFFTSYDCTWYDNECF